MHAARIQAKINQPPPKKPKAKKPQLLTKDSQMAVFQKQKKLERYIHISLPVCKTEEASGRTGIMAIH